MLTRVEAARGIRATKPIPGVLLDRRALIARVEQHVSRELPAEAIRNEGLALQLLGFLPTQFDYEAAEYRLLRDQLAGYYEPADGTMYMASDLADEEADATLAHELVHALQDQRWNIEERSKYRPGQGDLSEAVSALAEGDATSAMFDVITARAAPGEGKTALDLPDEIFSAQIREGMDRGPGADAPRVMRASLAAPYIYGTLFVHALRRRGGWDAVNRAWDSAPLTSEQILHVDKWLAHEPALKVERPAFDTLGPGWLISDEDSEGELGTRVAFEEWTDPQMAADASEGWGGDRAVLLTNGGQVAFAWRLRYDAGKTKEGRAARTFPTIARGLSRTLGPSSIRAPDFECYERADRGPIAIGRSGADLVFVAGPAATTVAGAWASAGNCAVARRWVTEIASRP
ncbi:MAG: hypothetical protein M3O36_10750 [Myxococcota bacterium]|nr:hypothetical protein [Myxococcota bacterium]